MKVKCFFFWGGGRGEVIKCRIPKGITITIGIKEPKLMTALPNIITINVPLFKKLRDIIFFLRDNNFMNHVKGHFEGAMTFLTP